MASLDCFLPDQAATEMLGKQLAACCSGGAVVFLHGDLGAGKTTLVRGFLRACGHSGPVKSPTYTLVEPYDIEGRTFYHLDLYRLADPGELEWIGIRDLFDAGTVCLIEWPEQGDTLLPEADLHVYLETEGEGRRARVEAGSAHGHGLLQCLLDGR